MLSAIECLLLLAKHDGCLMFTDAGFEDASAKFPSARTVTVGRPPSADEGVRPRAARVLPRRGTTTGIGWPSAFTWEAQGRRRRSHMYVAEFTLHPKPGHFEELAEIHPKFAADFLSDHPALQTVLVLGDEASGVVRGIAVYTDREAADEVNSDPEFASYNDRIGPLLASPSERVELQLLHHYSR